MFEIDLYNEEVLRAFHEKKDQDKLIHLQRATRADLMKECLMRLENGELENDIPVLAKIFNSEGNVESLKTAIKKATADKFRPIQDFIQIKTSKPTDNIIALLAIFIDFEPRPFEQWRNIQRNKNDGEKEKEEDTGKERKDDGPSIGKYKIPNTEIPNTDKSSLAAPTDISTNKINGQEIMEKEFSKKKKKQSLIFSGIGIFTTALLIIWYMVAIPKDCMCWNGEKYIQVDCQDKTQAYQVIGLDQDRLEHFRKITQPDSLGVKDIGNIWYSKIDNEVEFFTGPGYHPVQPNKSLKAVTRHIWDTYVRIKPDSNQHVQFGIMQKQK
ncbi:hypothetical protein [Sphingobacterium prati]|uniref:hypothetical protein n=1 Tax=Sphingobacterium prati TaxID=2737006 RepID=UPI001552007A|nr:hypothetical protein [Sphingobacterium prati]NPE46391.1 hypothetical protein [Sphingobacterium prati]